MAKAKLEPTIQYLRHIFADRTSGDRTDGDLLHEFLSANSHYAFAQLVKHHGPMVLGICRRALRHEQDAEDAFQATFLVLARQAATIRKQESLASWLHGVALNMAKDARKAAARRRIHENKATASSSSFGQSSELAWSEARAILDEEIQRLPAIYRESFILCCLESKSSAEVAQSLRLKPGTVWSRVARAKERLQKRLSKRGVELAVLLSAAAISSGSALAAVPAGLIGKTSIAALEMIGNTESANSAISLNVIALVKGMIKGMVISQVKTTSLLVLIFVLATAGVGVAAARWLPNHATSDNLIPQQQTVVQGTVPAPEAQRASTDQFGDALPPGAVARVGTVRLRHGSLITHIAFAPDSKSIISSGTDGFVHQWELKTGKELSTLDLNNLQLGTRHRPTAYFLGADDAVGLALSPSGKAIAVAGMNSQPFIWDLTTGRIAQFLGNDQTRADQIAFSIDGARVAYGAGKLIGGDDDLSITLVDATTGKELRQFVGHSRKVEQFVFSPDDLSLISASQDETVRIWGPEPGIERRLFKARTFAPSSDGKAIALATADGELGIYDPETGKLKRKLEGKADQQPILLFSPNGKALFGGGRSDKMFQIWDTETGRSRTVNEPAMPNNRRDRQLHAPTLFTPDGKLLIRGYRDGFIRFWDIATGQSVRQFRAHNDSVMRLALSPDGKVLASTQHGGTTDESTVRLWDVATGEQLLRPDVAESSVGMLAFSPDSGKIAVSTWDGSNWIAESNTGKQLRRLSTFGPSAFLPDGRTLLTGGWTHGELRLWDMSTFQSESFGSHTEGISNLAISKDGKWLVTQGHHLIRLWKISSPRVVHEFGGKQPSLIIGCSLSADGKIMASANQDHELRVWDAQSEKLMWKHRDADSIYAIAISPDGRLISWAAIAENGRSYPIRVAEVKSGKILRVLSGDWAPGIKTLAFSADGRTIFGGGEYSNRVLVWEVATGKLRTVLVGHTGSITSLAPLADGSRLASGSSDSTTLIWDLTGAGEINRADEMPLSQAKLTSLWQDLSSTEATIAYESMRVLRQHPKEAIEIFTNQVKPVPGPDLEQVRQGRVLEVVEWIGDDRSNGFLKALAGGSPDAWLTLEAKASLERLAIRSKRGR